MWRRIDGESDNKIREQTTKGLQKLERDVQIGKRNHSATRRPIVSIVNVIKISRGQGRMGTTGTPTIGWDNGQGFGSSWESNSSAEIKGRRALLKYAPGNLQEKTEREHLKRRGKHV